MKEEKKCCTYSVFLANDLLKWKTQGGTVGGWTSNQWPRWSYNNIISTQLFPWMDKMPWKQGHSVKEGKYIHYIQKAVNAFDTMGLWLQRKLLNVNKAGAQWMIPFQVGLVRWQREASVRHSLTAQQPTPGRAVGLQIHWGQTWRHLPQTCRTFFKCANLLDCSLFCQLLRRLNQTRQK